MPRDQRGTSFVQSYLTCSHSLETWSFIEAEVWHFCPKAAVPNFLTILLSPWSCLQVEDIGPHRYIWLLYKLQVSELIYFFMLFQQMVIPIALLYQIVPWHIIMYKSRNGSASWRKGARRSSEKWEDKRVSVITVSGALEENSTYEMHHIQLRHTAVSSDVTLGLLTSIPFFFFSFP